MHLYCTGFLSVRQFFVDEEDHADVWQNMEQVWGHPFVKTPDAFIPHGLTDTIQRSCVLRMAILQSCTNNLKQKEFITYNCTNWLKISLSKEGSHFRPTKGNFLARNQPFRLKSGPREANKGAMWAADKKVPRPCFKRVFYKV